MAAMEEEKVPQPQQQNQQSQQPSAKPERRNARRSSISFTYVEIIHVSLYRYDPQDL